MPDLGAIMSNPMFASMAQNIMSNPNAMGELMNNPQIRQMAQNMGLGGGAGGAGARGAGSEGGGTPSGGGGLPDLGALMNDPSMREM